MKIPHIISAFGRVIVLTLALYPAIQAPEAFAHGEAGDDVKELQKHLPEYAESVDTFLGVIEEVVASYESAGSDQTDTQKLIDAWEEAKMHAAIEQNHIPLYAGIWQGIYGIKEGIEAGEPVAEVRAVQAELTKTLWQSLGAVKMAAKIQEERRASGSPGGKVVTGHAATLRAITAELDRVVGKAAERDFEAAEKIVHETYENLFEGVEDELKALDAALVTDLEKALNVDMPMLLRREAALPEAEEAVEAIKAKLDRARELFAGAGKN